MCNGHGEVVKDVFQLPAELFTRGSVTKSLPHAINGREMHRTRLHPFHYGYSHTHLACIKSF